MKIQDPIISQEVSTNPELYFPERHKDGRAIIGYLSFEPHGFQRVHCLDVDGTAVYGGDVVLGATAHMAEVEALCQQAGITHFRRIKHENLNPTVQGVIETSKAWPNRTIYYTIDSSLAKSANVLQAMQNWEATGLYNMVERTSTSQTNYIQIQTNDSKPGNYSNSIGMKGGMQIINFKENYSVGTATHELGHAIGLNHEQKRYDAESYLNINWDNIVDDETALYQYSPDPDGTTVGHYDYFSIMQYHRGSSSNAKNKDVDILTPYDANAYIGQREALSVFDMNAAQSMYSDTISSIQVSLQTGSNGTNNDVYLGIGGREFNLSNSGNDRSANSVDIYTLGAGATVNDASKNDPRTPALTVREILSFPAYIRLDGSDGWSLTSVTVTIQGIMGNSFPDFTFRYRPGSIYLDSSASQYAQLLRYPATGTPHIQDDFSIRSISVTTQTGSSATNDDVYLGIAGREFLMDTSNNNFESNAQDTFVFGVNANVENASINDPRTPCLLISDLNSNPFYIRKSGNDDWDLSAASVVVSYQNAQGSPAGQDVSFDLVAGGLPLTEDSGAVAYLKYANRSVRNIANISKITASVSTGSSSTNDDIYLGIAGREFRLDSSNNDFNNNTTDNFVLGAGANVSNASSNDPRTPQLTLMDALTYNVYIRKDGTDGWSIQSATVRVEFEDASEAVVFNTYFNSELNMDNDAGMTIGLVKQ